jgi:aminoglycoside phosphotransferase (APT) family kinase protein
MTLTAADPRDPVLDASTVLNLSRRHLPSATAVTDIDESGGEARTYAIDETFIFKTQRPHRVRPRTSLEKEVFHLQQLASRAPEVSVPRVLGYGHDGDLEYILMTRMPGVAMRQVTLDADARLGLLRELGASLRQMHDLDPEPFRASQLFPGDADSSEMRARVERDLARAIETASADRQAWTLPLSPEAAAARAHGGLDTIAEAPVPLHSNPGPEHVFVDPDTLRLSGVIDFGDAYLSHPALDFRRWAHPRDRAALMHGYTRTRQLSDSFHSNWRAISITMLMLDFGTRPSRRQESLEGLQVLLDDMPS